MTYPARRLEADAISCTRGEREVFAGLSLQAANGEAVLLRGPNGAGKTSLLMCLAGLIPVAEGTITWHGRDPEQRPGEDMHFVGHLGAVKPSLTVAENLAFWCDVNGGSRAGIDDALAAAGIGALAPFEAGILSAGQTRRLSLARLLVAPRPVWLLDEPTSALDAAGDAWLCSLVDRHIDDGGLVIAATHLDLGLKDRSRVRTVPMGGMPV